MYYILYKIHIHIISYHLLPFRDPFHHFVFRLHRPPRPPRHLAHIFLRSYAMLGPHPPEVNGSVHPWKGRKLLGCPVGFVRINGERINGLFHLVINGVYNRLRLFPLVINGVYNRLTVTDPNL